MCSIFRYGVVVLPTLLVLPGSLVAEEISDNYPHIDYSDKAQW